MLRTSIFADTDDFSGCSRSISISPLNFVNLPLVVPRNWWTLNPIVECDWSNLYVSFASTAELSAAGKIRLTTKRVRIFILNFRSQFWFRVFVGHQRFKQGRARQR